MPEPLSAGFITQLVLFFSDLIALLSPFLRLSLWLRGFRLVSARESSFIKSCWGVVSWLRGGCHVVWCGLFSFSYSNFVLFLAFVCPSYIHFDLIFFVNFIQNLATEFVDDTEVVVF